MKDAFAGHGKPPKPSPDRDGMKGKSPKKK